MTVKFSIISLLLLLAAVLWRVWQWTLPIGVSWLVVGVVALGAVTHRWISSPGSNEPPTIQGYIPHFGIGLAFIRDSRQFIARYMKIFDGEFRVYSDPVENNQGNPSSSGDDGTHSMEEVRTTSQFDFFSSKAPAWSFYIFGKRITFLMTARDLLEYHKSPENKLSFIEPFKDFTPGNLPTRGRSTLFVRHPMFIAAFSTPKLNGFAPVISQEAARFCRSSFTTVDPVELYRFCYDVILRMASPCLYGHSVSVPGVFDRYSTTLTALFSDSEVKGKDRILRVLDNILRIRHYRRIKDGLFEQLYEVLTPIVCERLAVLRNSGNVNANYEPGTAGQDSSPASGEPPAANELVSFLDSILTLRIQKEQRQKARNVNVDDDHYSVIDIIHDVNAAAFASLSNSPASLFWTLLHIHKDPNLLSSIRQELDTVMGDSEVVTIAILERLHLLRATLLEVVRMYWAGLRLRKVMQDFKLSNGWVLPAGRMHFAAEPVYWMNHNEVLFPDPLAFKPERHLKINGQESEAQKVGILFTPFGYGRHSCLGERFALLQLATVVRQITKQFNVQLCSGDAPAFSVKQIATTLRPATPFFIRLSPRSA